MLYRTEIDTTKVMSLVDNLQLIAHKQTFSPVVLEKLIELNKQVLLRKGIRTIFKLFT
jgi:hypothetical protein